MTHLPPDSSAPQPHCHRASKPAALVCHRPATSGSAGRTLPPCSTEQQTQALIRQPPGFQAEARPMSLATRPRRSRGGAGRWRRRGHKATVWRCRRVVMDVELGADLIAVGVVDLLEDPHRPGPGLAGRGKIARAAVDVAEAVERVGLVETVGELPGEADGPLEACDGLPEVTAMVVGVAETVPGGTLPAPFPYRLHHGQGPFATGDGLLIV